MLLNCHTNTSNTVCCTKGVHFFGQTILIKSALHWNTTTSKPFVTTRKQLIARLWATKECVWLWLKSLWEKENIRYGTCFHMSSSCSLSTGCHWTSKALGTSTLLIIGSNSHCRAKQPFIEDVTLLWHWQSFFLASMVHWLSTLLVSHLIYPVPVGICFLILWFSLRSIDFNLWLSS